MDKIELREVDISSKFPLMKFEQVIQLVLKKGDRKSYCNRFNNSPHYLFTSFHLYLNPINQQINFTVNSLSSNPGDYESLTIQDFHAQFHYYHIKVKENKVILYDYYCKDDDEFDLMQSEFFAKYYPEIVKEFSLE